MALDSSIWNDLYKETAPRIKKKQGYLSKHIGPDDTFFLELFVATGQNIATFKSHKPDSICVGVDYDINLCKIAKENGFMAVVADCRNLPFKKNSFDIIYSNSYHHVSECAKIAIENTLSLLKKDGSLVGVEPYGLISIIGAGIIFFTPDLIMSLFPGKFRKWIRAIKYECKNERVIDWYFKYNFLKDLRQFNVASIHRDLLRVYYCLKKTA